MMIYRDFLLPRHEVLISARRGQHLQEKRQHINFCFQSWRVFFGLLSSASILRVEELTHLLYIHMLSLETQLP